MLWGVLRVHLADRAETDPVLKYCHILPLTICRNEYGGRRTATWKWEQGPRLRIKTRSQRTSDTELCSTLGSLLASLECFSFCSSSLCRDGAVLVSAGTLITPHSPSNDQHTCVCNHASVCMQAHRTVSFRLYCLVSSLAENGFEFKPCVPDAEQ